MFRTSSKEEKVTSLSSVDLLSHLELLKKSKFKEMFGEINLACQLPEWKKIKDIGEVVSGATPNTGNDEFWNGSFKWITPAEIDKDAFWIEATERTLTQVGIDSKNLKLLPKGTVLLTSRAPIGKVALANCEMCSNQGFKNIICSEQIEPVFLYFLLKNNTSYLNSLGRGATFKEVSKEIVENIKIPVPPIQKQSAFITFINHIEKIKQTIQLILAKLELLKKSKFKEMFGNILLNDRKLKIYKFSEVLDIKNGKNQKSVISQEGKYPICGSGGIMGYASDWITKENSVIIGRKGNINKPLLMREKFWNIDTAFGLEPDNALLTAEYLFEFCKRFDFGSLNKTVTIPSLTKTDLLKISIPVPPIREQREFIHFLNQIEKTKQTLQKSLYDLTGEA